MHSRHLLPCLAVLCLVSCGLARAQNVPLDFGISLPASLNFATSPSPVGSGARAVGKGTAFIGVADDATAASHNPAGLVQLEQPEVSIVGSYYLRFEQQDVHRSETLVAGQTLDSLHLNYLSVAYPFELFSRNVVVSLNVQRLFDLRGVTDVSARFIDLDGVQNVHSRQTGGLYTFSPAVAVQVTPTFSVGAAFNIWPDLLDNGWEQEVRVDSQGFTAVGNSSRRFTSQGRIQEKFQFEGFNATVGFLWTINPTFSLGGVFRSPFTAKVTQTHTSSLTVEFPDIKETVTGQANFRQVVDMEMPMSYGLGLAARLSKSLTLSFDVARIHWSDFRLQQGLQSSLVQIENGAPSGKGKAVLDGQADDTTSVRLGAEYLMIRPVSTPWLAPRLVIPVRAGVFYDPEPGDGGTDHFFGFSLGTGVAVKQFVLDMAYTFRAGTVQSAATDTGVTQHTFLTSIIYHF